MTKEQEIQLSDREVDPIRKVAELLGLTEDEAATKLLQEAIANRYKRSLNRAPATVYTFKARK